MTLRRRLLLQVGLTVAAALAVGVSMGVEQRTEARLAATNAHALDVVRQTADAQALLFRYASDPSGPNADLIAGALGRLRGLVDSLSGRRHAHRDWARRVRPAAGRMLVRFHQVRQSVTAGAAAPPLVEPLRADGRGIIADAVALAALGQDAAARSDRRLDVIVLVTLAALVTTLFSLTWWLVVRLGRRLSALHAGATALAGGNFSHRVPTAASDELGALTRTFNQMAEEVEGAVTYARLKVEELDAAQAVLQRRVGQQAAVVELGASALADAPLEDLERAAARLVAAGLGVEFAEVLTRDPEADRLRLAAGVGWRPGTVGVAVAETDVESQARFTLRQGGPVVVDDLAAETRFAGPPLLTEHGARSGISVVIGDAAQPYGVLGAHSATARGFTEDDVAFVQAVANQLGQAAGARTARDALRESERRYQDLYDNAPAMFWSVELASGRILACNGTAARVLGYEREELVGRSVFDLYTPECHAAVRAGIRNLQATGAVRDETLAVRRRDGTILDVSLQATAVRDPEGQVVASRTTWIDISASRRAERALKLSRDRLAQAERVARMGNWHWDAHTGRITWSDGHCRLFGLEARQFAGTYDAYMGMVHPGDRPTVEDRLRWYLAEKRGGEGEYRIVRADGEVRYLRATAEVVVDAHGVVTSMFGTSTDVTDRRRLEEQLRHVVEHSTNVFYAHTPDHVLTYVSPQVRDVLDCEPEEALVRWTELLTDHPDNPAGIAATERAIATGKRQPPYELELRTLRGRIIWVEVHEAPLVQDGKTVAIVGALTDITQRRQVEDALRRERELLDRIVNNVPVLLGLFDGAGRVLFVNRAWELVLGWSLGECRAHPDLMAEFYPDETERRRMLDHIRTATGEWEDFRTRIRDGRILDTMWANVRLSDGTLIGIGQDITERKAAERHLVVSEERLRLAVTAANQGLFDANVRTGRSVVSPEYSRMLGYEPDELEMTHEAWLERMHPDDRDGAAARFADCIARRTRDYQAEFRLRARDGTWKWILSVGKVVEWDGDGRPARFLGTHTDITARRAAEEEVRASRERIRELAFAQEQARETERARMARELHDEMGQALTGFKMDLSWLRGRIPPTDHDADTRAGEALDLVNGMVDVVRRMSGELRPGVLDDLGLGAAIRWQVREFQRRSGLTTAVTGVDDIPEMDPGRALAIFRIVQEALTNVARHAQAATVAISVTATAAGLRVEIRDDGCGIQLTSRTRVPLGILGMQERAAAWGGTVSVGAAAPRGTVVELAMPVDVPAA
jgi:PAS domain S-box-containing protein